MKNKLKKLTSLAIGAAITITSALSPAGYISRMDLPVQLGAAEAFAQDGLAEISIILKGDDGGDGIIYDGETDVGYSMREMTFDVVRGYRSISEDMEPQDILDMKTRAGFEESYEGSASENIRVFANGRDETYKFEITDERMPKGSFKIKLRDDVKGSEKAYELRKFALYTIYMPQGTFKTKDGGFESGAVSHSFVTGTNERRLSPTIKSSWPEHAKKSVSCEDATIEFEFPSDVEFTKECVVEEGRLKNASEFLRISTTPVSPYIPSYNMPPSYSASDSADNYDVYIEGNRLVARPKAGKFKDFANYTVELKNRTVFLKRTEQGKKIYNTSPGNYSDWTRVEFSTGSMIESSYPQPDQTGVHTEPRMEMEFKYPIEFVDEGRKVYHVYITNDAGEKVPLAYEEIIIDEDEPERLVIDVNDEGDIRNRLRKNTLYTLRIDGGTIRFRDYPVENEDIELSFITGSEGESPEVTSLRSSPESGVDITSPASDLQPDGSVYVLMDRPVEWDKRFDPAKLREAVKLYKMPAPSKEEYSGGVLTDRIFEYEYSHEDGMVCSADVLEEIPVGEVAVGDGASAKNAIRITPKELSSGYDALDPFSRYKVFISRDYIDDENGYNMNSDIEEFFWTGGKDEGGSASWDLSSIKAGSIEKGESAPYIEEWTLYGAPAYSPKGEDGRPIVISTDSSAYLNMEGSHVIEPSQDERGEALRVPSLEGVQIRSAYYKGNGKIIYEGQNEAEMLVGQKLSMELDSSMAGSGVRFESGNPKVAEVSSEGDVTALSSGEVDIYVVSSSGDLMATLSVKAVQTDVHIQHITIERISDGAGSEKGGGEEGEETAGATRISIYPSETLKRGKAYTLAVPAGTFKSASGEELDELVVKFAVAGDRDEDTGIYGASPDEISFSDIARDKAQFTLRGYNFYEAIDSAILHRKNDGTHQDVSIEIPEEDIYFRSVDRMDLAIRGDVRDEIISNNKLYTGSYKIEIRFKDGKSCMSDEGAIELAVVSRPQVISVNPYADGFDEKSLAHPVKDDRTEGVSFARVEFDESIYNVHINSDSGLTSLMGSTVRAKGSYANLVDREFVQDIIDMGDYDRQKEIEKYLLVRNEQDKTATLYIPIKGLLSDTEYEFTLSEGVVTNNPIGASSDEDELNEEIAWTARSQGEPEVGEIVAASAPEGYDRDEHMIVRGDFGHDVKVYFADHEAEDVIISDDGNTLRAYLPYSGGRLDPGTYDVRIVSDENHDYTIYSGFTIVKSTELEVGEGEQKTEDDSKGELVQSVEASKGIIRLKSRYSDDRKVKLDISQMLSDPRSARIELDADEGDGIGRLELEYGDSRRVTIYGIELEEDSDDYPVSITVGSADPAVRDMVRGKMFMLSHKSNFIQIKCENIEIEGVDMSIPYRESYGDRLKVLRYDFETRGIYDEEDCHVDRSKLIVNVVSDHPGVFVVVEEY